MRLGFSRWSFLIVVLLFLVSAIRAEDSPWPQTLDCRRLLHGLGHHRSTVQTLNLAEKALAANWRNRSKDGYTQFRTHKVGVNSYFGLLGDEYLKAVDFRNPRRRWLDLGSGYAYSPVDVLNEFGPDAGEIVSLAYRFPEDLDREAITKQFPHQISFIETLAEDLSDRNLGEFDLITSSAGAFSYGTHIDIILYEALRLLKPGGKFISHHPHPGVEPAIVYSQNNLENWNLITYLESISGVTFTRGHSDGHSIPFVLERNSDPLYVPPLFLASYDLLKPPVRRYVITTEEEAEQILNVGPYSKRFSAELTATEEPPKIYFRFPINLSKLKNKLMKSR